MPCRERKAGANVPRPARQKRASEKSRDTRVLDPTETRVRVNAHGELEIELPDGTVHADVRVVPAFPISRPNQFVHVEDAEGAELGVVLEPRRLDRESRDLVLAQADQAYFMPRVSRIVRVDERMGIARWEVETDRGWASFDVVSRSESVWYVGKDRLVIRDADGNRYLIEDLSKLDRRSRRLADLFL